MGEVCKLSGEKGSEERVNRGGKVGVVNWEVNG